MIKILNPLIEIAGAIYLVYSIFTHQYLLSIIVLLSFILIRLDYITKRIK
jgi:hypothetical protein